MFLGRHIFSIERCFSLFGLISFKFTSFNLLQLALDWGTWSGLKCCRIFDSNTNLQRDLNV